MEEKCEDYDAELGVYARAKIRDLVLKKKMFSFYRANSIKAELSGRDITNGVGVQSASSIRPAEIRHLRKPISRLTNIQILSAIKIFISTANFFEYPRDLLYPGFGNILKGIRGSLCGKERRN